MNASRSWYICFFLAGAMSVCVPYQNAGGAEKYEGAMSFADFIPVNFRHAQPESDHQSYVSSVEDSTNFEKIMEENLLVAQESDGKKIRVIGSTDDTECENRGCLYLSIRRALIVQDWLVAHGISRRRFDPILVLGKDYPISDNDSEEGRRGNRRAELGISD